MSDDYLHRFTDDMTLAEARDLLRTLVTDGHTCPCCQQMAKVYRRRVNSGMARELLAMYRTAGVGHWVHVRDVERSAGGGEVAKMRHWGLVQPMPARRDDGGHAGYWRVTPHGEAWLSGQCRIPKYALLYNSRLLRLDDTQTVTISDALGEPFDLRDLMARHSTDTGQAVLPL
jgi:hypothetical protein